MAGAVVDFAKMASEKIGQLSDKYVAPYIADSAETMLKKMGPQGEVLLNQVKKYESAWKSGADDIQKTTGLSLEDSAKMSKQMNSNIHFGRDKQFITNQLNAIEKQYKTPETGAIKKRTAADIMSVYFKEPGTQTWRAKAGVDPNSPFTKRSDLESAWYGFSSWVYLSKIAIPHTMQFLNLLLEGRSTAAFAKALFEWAPNPNAAVRQIERSGALVDEYLHASRANTSTSKAIENIFHMPGLKWMRKYQIALSAIDGKYSAIESASKYQRSGFTSNAEETYLRHLGIDPKDIKQYGLRQQDIDKAMYQIAHNTMYIRTGLEVPYKWEENSAMRLATQYKGYSFNQARIMADAYRRAAAMGETIPQKLANMSKVTAVIAGIFPIAGEFIWSIDSLVNTGDPTNRDDVMKMLDDGGPIDNTISALSHLAGLGIGYSVMRAANRNGLESFMIGPLGNFVTDEYTGLQHAVMTGDTDRIVRTNLRKVPVAGSYLQRQVLPTQAQEREDEQK